MTSFVSLRLRFALLLLRARRICRNPECDDVIFPGVGVMGAEAILGFGAREEERGSFAETLEDLEEGGLGFLKEGALENERG